MSEPSNSQSEIPKKNRQPTTHENLAQLIKPWHNSSDSHPTTTHQVPKTKFTPKNKLQTNLMNTILEMPYFFIGAMTVTI
jgi:hypothetical protein